MVWRGYTRAIAEAAIVTLSLVTLSACATTTGPGGEPTLTLAETKSPVQLLRNEAASRIDEFIVETVDETEDVSAPCKTAEADPLGLTRLWTSSVEVSLKEGSAWRASIVADDLVASFEAQGWTAARGAPSAVTYTTLKSENSTATIGLTVTTEDVAAARPAKLQITTKGPCVVTGGSESDEVKRLEASS
jgi:hypothetical protein